MMRMKTRSSAFLILSTTCLLLLSFSIPSHSEVITLTSDTFSDKIKEKDTVWFVKFCVPWCKHCKNLGSLWDDMGKAMENEDAIEIGEVDCVGTDTAVCSKVDIYAYPTFKIFYDGEELAKYQGTNCGDTMDVESLKAFVLDEAEKAAAKAQLDSHDEL